MVRGQGGDGMALKLEFVAILALTVVASAMAIYGWIAG